jgi:acetylornithine deacetylase/succinyl-diaminopimelate desuccinylase-like protein
MDVLALTEQLVAIDSQNPGPFEGEIAAWIDAWARERGLDSRIVEISPGRPNLVVSLDRGGPGHLALSGHLDTKPIGDAGAEWHTPPLELTIVDQMAYGLGATDMKGAVAAMMVAVERLMTAPGTGKLTLLLTADEEQGSDHGAKAMATKGLLPAVDAVVIGEPSGVREPWESIHLVSRGICCFEVEVNTRQGHSSLSHMFGRNAILVAADLLHAFEDLRPEVDSPGMIACSPTVNPGITVAGGVGYGTWPGRCLVGIEIRLVPGMSQQALHRQVTALVDRVAGPRAQIRYAPGSQGWMPAVELAPDSPVARAARTAAEHVLGRPVPFGAFPGGTDATHLLGVAGIPTVASLGPGWISVAHGADERVGVDQLTQAVDIYQHLATTFLEEAAHGLEDTSPATED